MAGRELIGCCVMWEWEWVIIVLVHFLHIVDIPRCKRNSPVNIWFDLELAVSWFILIWWCLGMIYRTTEMSYLLQKRPKNMKKGNFSWFVTHLFQIQHIFANKTVKSKMIAIQFSKMFHLSKNRNKCKVTLLFFYDIFIWFETRTLSYSFCSQNHDKLYCIIWFAEFADLLITSIWRSLQNKTCG